MHNVEKSKFQKGMYVGYGGGAVWHIRSYGKGNWKATPQGNNSHKVFTCATLRDVSTQLEALNAPKAKGETFAELVKSNPAPRKEKKVVKYGIGVLDTLMTFEQAKRWGDKNMPPDLKKAGFKTEVFISDPEINGGDFFRVNYGKTINSARKTNPAKRAPKNAPSARVGKTRKQYVSRPSQAPGHKAPSKRLQARRKKALNAPKGYFPNPLEAGVSSGKAGATVFPFHVQYRGSQTGKWNSIAAFEYKEDAFAYAKKLARDEPGFTLRVMKDE